MTKEEKTRIVSAVAREVGATEAMAVYAALSIAKVYWDEADTVCYGTIARNLVTLGDDQG